MLITGPMRDDVRAPQDIEEAWLLEKLYGPPQRWVIDVVSLEKLWKAEIDPGEMFSLLRVDGVDVGVHSSATVERLNIELHGDAIRVRELDGRG